MIPGAALPGTAVRRALPLFPRGASPADGAGQARERGPPARHLRCRDNTYENKNRKWAGGTGERIGPRADNMAAWDRTLRGLRGGSTAHRAKGAASRGVDKFDGASANPLRDHGARARDQAPRMGSPANHREASRWGEPRSSCWGASRSPCSGASSRENG